VSQEQLASRLGLTQSAVTRIESGERAITVAEVFEIAAALNVAPIYLLTGSFTSENVTVAGHDLEPEWARLWITGNQPLDMSDRDGASTYLHRNIPDDVAGEYQELGRMLKQGLARDREGMLRTAAEVAQAQILQFERLQMLQEEADDAS
jgi:transcriptional regulator with XRE-family HTH domain